MELPNIFKQIRCKHDWGKSYVLKYDPKHKELFTDTSGLRQIVTGHFCHKCNKYEYHLYIGFPKDEDQISLKEFHRIRRGKSNVY